MSCKEYIPFRLRKGVYAGSVIPIKCGKCILCRIDRRRDWTQRMVWEWQSCNYLGHFVTLTYRNDCLNGPNLDYKDIQLWLKRLRKRLGPNRIKFYAAGEYGEETFRKHWHVCIFGDCPRLHIIKSWGKGLVDIKPLHPNRIRYVLKYLDKEMFFNEEFFASKYPGFVFPMHHMSNGIGAAWLDAHKDEIQDGYIEYAGPRGHIKRINIPRYYRSKYGLPSPVPYIDPERKKQFDNYRLLGYSYIKAYNAVYDSFAKAKEARLYSGYARTESYMRSKILAHWPKSYSVKKIACDALTDTGGADVLPF